MGGIPGKEANSDKISINFLNGCANFSVFCYLKVH